MASDLIYLDNAATSWPKPPEVAAAMTHFLGSVGANPGRAGHRLAVEAARVVYNTREALAAWFGAPDPMRVVFTVNVTEALNLALYGLLRPGDHVITSSMEHNAVMRPLRMLEQRAIEVAVIGCSPEGQLDTGLIAAAIQPNTRLIVLNHASNVVGTLLPVHEAGAIARRHNLLLLVDAAQTAGAYPLDMRTDAIDLLAFTGHKALLGPMGTGGLIIGERVDVEHFVPLKQGGTGSHSEHEQQPAFLPDRFESGTLNAVGLAGLGAGLHFLQAQTLSAIRAHEIAMTQRLIDGLRAIPGLTVYGTGDAQAQTATVSFTFRDLTPSEAAERLDEDFGVLCRVGLHCAPAAHRTLGTYPAGTVRFGMGYFTTAAEIDRALRAVEQLARIGR